MEPCQAEATIQRPSHSRTPSGPPVSLTLHPTKTPTHPPPKTLINPPSSSSPPPAASPRRNPQILLLLLFFPQESSTPCGHRGAAAAGASEAEAAGASEAAAAGAAASVAAAGGAAAAAAGSATRAPRPRLSVSASPPPPPLLGFSLCLLVFPARFGWFLMRACVGRGVDVHARVRGGRGDEADEREGALLQRAHLPPEQDPDRQGRRDLRPHQRIRELLSSQPFSCFGFCDETADHGSLSSDRCGLVNLCSIVT